ncbi:MAG: GAF domain-containing protein [Chloroflexia bacterium]|nr:GAF domain-containing protein [Chloroflexia bacterium]
MNDFLQRMRKLVTLPWNVSTARRRRRMLRILLVAMTAFVLGSLLLLLLARAFFSLGGERELWLFVGTSLVVVFGSLLLYALGRYSSRWASWLFVLLLFGLALFSSFQENVLGGYSVVLFIMPMSVASILVAPYLSPLIALLGILATVGVGRYLQQPFQLASFLPSLAVLLGVSLLLWLVTYLWQQTLADWHRANSRLDLLYRAGHALGSTLALEEVLLTVMREIHRFLDVAACTIWLVDAETGELVCWQSTDPNSESFRGWRLAPGEGLAGQVAQQGRDLLVADAQLDPQHYKGLDERTGLETHSILSTPLRGRQQEVIGVLQVVDTAVDRFSPEEVKLLEPLVSSAANAIENARLYEQARRQSETLATLQETMQSLAARQGLAEVLSDIVVRAVGLLDALAGGLYLYRVETDDLELAYRYNLEQVPLGTVLQRGEGLAGRVLESGQALSLEDYAAWEGRSAHFAEVGAGLACLAVPIRWGDQVQGVLGLIDEAPRAFTSEEMTRLQRLTALAALALENDRLLGGQVGGS